MIWGHCTEILFQVTSALKWQFLSRCVEQSRTVYGLFVCTFFGILPQTAQTLNKFFFQLMEHNVLIQYNWKTINATAVASVLAPQEGVESEHAHPTSWSAHYTFCNLTTFQLCKNKEKNNFLILFSAEFLLPQFCGSCILDLTSIQN